jgi:hypothetical protein
MVVIDTVGSRFEANLLAAKLGANGHLWQLRSNYPSIYTGERPFGGIDLLVPADEAEEARLVLAADAELMPDVVFDGQDPADFEPSTTADRSRPLLVAGAKATAFAIVGLLLIEALAVIIRASFG